MVPMTTQLYRGMSGRHASSIYTTSFNFTTNFDLSAYANTMDNNSELIIKKNNADIMTLKLTDSNHKIISVKQKEDDTLYTTTITINIDVCDDEFDFSTGSTSAINLMNGTNISAVPEDIMFSLKGKISANGTTFDFVAETSETQSFFQNLDNMLFSNIVTNTEVYTQTGDTTSDATSKIRSITLKDVPVIHSSYFKNNTEDKKDKFINQLFTYIKILKENIEKLETNTFFDIKFYNTYGYSYIYNSNTTNLTLDLNIHLEDAYINNESVKSQIKSYIRRLVDLTNNTGRLGISNITGLVDNKYADYIKYIEFVGLNDTFSQCVEKKKGVDETMQVLEWINIPPETLDKHIKFV
jgi:hypothetical protein